MKFSLLGCLQSGIEDTAGTHVFEQKSSYLQGLRVHTVLSDI